MTTTRASRTKKKAQKRVNNDLVLRYEDAWNYLVSMLPAWKKKIVIEKIGDELNKDGERVIEELSHEVAKLAESNRKIPPPVQD